MNEVNKKIQINVPMIEYNKNLCFDMFLFPLLMNYNDVEIT